MGEKKTKGILSLIMKREQPTTTIREGESSRRFLPGKEEN